MSGDYFTSPLATRAMKKVHPALLLSFVLALGASAVTAQERFSPYVPSELGNVECTSGSGLAFIHMKQTNCWIARPDPTPRSPGRSLTLPASGHRISLSRRNDHAHQSTS